MIELNDKFCGKSYLSKSVNLESILEVLTTLDSMTPFLDWRFEIARESRIITACHGILNRRFVFCPGDKWGMFGMNSIRSLNARRLHKQLGAQPANGFWDAWPGFREPGFCRGPLLPFMIAEIPLMKRIVGQ